MWAGIPNPSRTRPAGFLPPGRLVQSPPYRLSASTVCRPPLCASKSRMKPASVRRREWAGLIVCLSGTNNSHMPRPERITGARQKSRIFSKILFFELFPATYLESDGPSMFWYSRPPVRIRVYALKNERARGGGVGRGRKTCSSRPSSPWLARERD